LAQAEGDESSDHEGRQAGQWAENQGQQHAGERGLAPCMGTAPAKAASGASHQGYVGRGHAIDAADGVFRRPPAGGIVGQEKGAPGDAFARGSHLNRACVVAVVARKLQDTGRVNRRAVFPPN
jgi:hypothetical protein